METSVGIKNVLRNLKPGDRLAVHMCTTENSFMSYTGKIEDKYLKHITKITTKEITVESEEYVPKQSKIDSYALQFICNVNNCFVFTKTDNNKVFVVRENDLKVTLDSPTHEYAWETGYTMIGVVDKLRNNLEIVHCNSGETYNPKRSCSRTMIEFNVS